MEVKKIYVEENNGRKTIGEILKELEEGLAQLRLLPDEYFNISAMTRPDDEFPECGWLGCFAVKGDSEGHYIHVEAIGHNGDHDKRKLLYLGKTFRGMDFAIEAAGALSKMVEDFEY